MQFSTLAATWAFGSLAMASPAPTLAPASSQSDLVERGWEVGGCWSCTLIHGHFLDCWCLTRDDAQSARTQLDLNKCIVNRGGSLQPQEWGNYYYSCRDSYLWYGLYLYSRCTSGDAYSSIYLDDAVSNDNGYLRCFGHNGCCIDGQCQRELGEC